MRRGLTAIIGRLALDLRDFDWSELRFVSACGYWPTAVYAVVCMGAMLLVMLLSGLVLLPGLSASWRAAQAGSADLVNERAALVRQLAMTSARNLSAVSRCPLCSGLHNHLLPAHPMPVVLDHLDGIAAARDISVSVLSPSRVWRQESLQAFEIDLQVTADPAQLMLFLSDIKNLPFALATKRLDWTLTASTARMILLLLVDSDSDDNLQNTAKGLLTKSVNALPPDLDNNAMKAVDTAVVDQREAVVSAGWQRIAFIQRGNRYLEVLRDTHGQTRRHTGRKSEGAP